MPKIPLLEHGSKRLRHERASLGIQATEPANKAAVVQRSHLIERYLPRAAVENRIDAIRKFLAGARHRRNDDGPNRLMHLVRRDHEARPDFSHLKAHRRIKAGKVNAEAFKSHHVHSLSSNSLGIDCHSRQSSVSSPCSATAARICSSQPSRGLRFFPLELIITLPFSTDSSTFSVRPACSITDLGRRIPRELPIRTSFAGSLGGRDFLAEARGADLEPRRRDWDFGFDGAFVAIVTL